ncbi:Uncharacterised protein [uncultured archaeon]|nr:Uncharacterised protein [uncultured archaeon]
MLVKLTTLFELTLIFMDPARVELKTSRMSVETAA